MASANVSALGQKSVHGLFDERLLVNINRNVKCQVAVVKQTQTRSTGINLPQSQKAKQSISKLLDQNQLDNLDSLRDYCTIQRPYNPERIREEVFSTTQAQLKLVARFFQMSFKLGTFAACMAADQISDRADNEDIIHKRADQLRRLLVSLGPSFIKAGQVLANRPDIIRQDYMNELCQLQDNVPSFPNDQAFAIMESSIGKPLGDVFSSISEKPVAAASIGQVYKAVLRDTGEEVAIKVQRPGVAPIIKQDLFIFRILGKLLSFYSTKQLGCNAELVVDEFGEKLLEELDYNLEALNIQDFRNNFEGDKYVKIPWVRQDLSSEQIIVMEWINGYRCTDVEAIKANLDVNEFIRVGVVSGLRQLLEFGLFHGDPHPGNIFAMPDGRIAYVDFGNVAQISQQNKQTLVDAVVHAVNEDYDEMANDFIKLGFLGSDSNLTPIIPALEQIWKDSRGKALGDFNFRTVTGKFNELVYKYPVRIPEKYALVIRSLLTQEGICISLNRNFHFLEVAYPYVAKRLLTDSDTSLRDRLIQVLFKNGKFQWQRLEDLISLANDGNSGGNLDISKTVSAAAQTLILDAELRKQIILAITEDDKLHVEEIQSLLDLVGDSIDANEIVQSTVQNIPNMTRQMVINWADEVLNT